MARSAAVPVARSEPNLTHLNGALLVLGTGLFFSFGGLAFRSTDDISAWEYLVFRGVGMLVATAIVLGIVHRRRLRSVLAQTHPTHIVAGVILGAINCLFIVSLDVTTVAFVLFFQTTAPITAAYFSWIILRERVSREVIVATMVSIVGVVVIVSGTLTDAVSPGALIAVMIPIGFGLYATLIRSTARIDPMVPILVGGITVLGAGSAVVLAGSGFEASIGDASIAIFAGSLLLAFPLAVFNVAQRVVPAPETALLLMGEVVLAPLWVWIFVDERPEPSTLAGGAIILGAVVWLTINRTPRRGRTLTSRG